MINLFDNGGIVIGTPCSYDLISHRLCVRKKVYGLRNAVLERATRDSVFVKTSKGAVSLCGAVLSRGAVPR
jgi:hypothetical protein